MRKAEMLQTVDMKRLAVANRLAHQWMVKLGIKKTNCFKFVKQVATLSPELFDKLSTEDQIALKNDADTIRYTMDIENDMIEQNFFFIQYVATRLKIKSFTDEHLSYGMMGMRKAIYYYTKDDIKFSTFCYNGIKTAFKHLYYFTKPKKTKANNAILATDMRNEDRKATLENMAIYVCETEEEECPADISDKKQLLAELTREAGLKDIQVKLVQAFMERQNVPSWLENFMATNNLTCSRQAVYTRLKRTIAKLKEAYDKRKGGNN